MTLHRSSPAADWRAVEIVCALPTGQFLCEERDRPLPGRFLAYRSDLRWEGGVYVYRPGDEPKAAVQS